MDLGIGAGDAAFDLWVLDPRGEQGERHRLVVRRLLVDTGPIDGPAVETGRGAGLQASEGKAEPRKSLRQAKRGALAHAAGRDLLIADMDQARQEGAGGDDHGPRRENAPIGQQETGDPALADDEIVRLPLDDGEIRRLQQLRLHGAGVELAVGLGARPAHGRALATVEKAELDSGLIGDAAHHAVEGIDLAHQMALAEPADGRIAGHGADGRELMGDKRRARTHARRCGGRFGPRVAAADDDHIEHRAHAISYWNIGPAAVSTPVSIRRPLILNHCQCPSKLLMSENSGAQPSVALI